jgi:hypothetical protein
VGTSGALTHSIRGCGYVGVMGGGWLCEDSIYPDAGSGKTQVRIALIARTQQGKIGQQQYLECSAAGKGLHDAAALVVCTVQGV